MILPLFIISLVIGVILAIVFHWIIGIIVAGIFYYWAIYVPTTPNIGQTKDDNKRNIRIGFAKKNLPKDPLDAIVIGSGMGGLTTAALLAKQGKRVLVLEQHDVVGGCTHAFTDMGFTFDVGLHYVGGDISNSRSGAARLFDQLCSIPVRWASQGDIVDMVVTDQSKFPIRGDFKKFKAEFHQRFPEEGEKIDKYFRLMKKTNEIYGPYFVWRFLPAFIQRWTARLLAHPCYKFSDKTVQDVFDEIGFSPELQLAFGYIFGDYGLPPNRASWLIHAMVQMHYVKGGYYPIGGAEAIAQAITPTIQKNGGQVLVRAPVKKIIVENGRAIGVTVEKNGKTTSIFAPIIISAAGVRNTVQRLLPSEVVQTQWPTALIELKEIGSSPGHLNLFIGLNGTQEELKLPKYNSWILKGNDDKSINELVDNFCETKTTVPAYMFVGFPSVKDPEYIQENPGKHICTVVTEFPYEWVEPWEDTTVKRRGEDYENFKKELESNLLEWLYVNFPQLKNKIKYTDLGTPLSNNYYIGSFQGESYGLEHSPQRFRATMTKARTPIPGLYLSGQDVTSAGIMGALMGGFSCAFAIDFRIFLKNIDVLLNL